MINTVRLDCTMERAGLMGFSNPRRRLGQSHHSHNRPSAFAALQRWVSEHTIYPFSKNMLTKPSQPYQLRQTHNATIIHQLPSTSIPTRHNALQRLRKGRPRANGLVPQRRQRLQRDPTHQAPNARLRPRRQPRRPPRLGPRETPRLDRRLPLDRRRDPNLGLALPLLHRRPRRQREDLLRGPPRRGPGPRLAGPVHPRREARAGLLPPGSQHPAETLGQGSRARRVREATR